VHQATSCLTFAVYDNLLHFWCPSSITMVHDIPEQAPSSLLRLWCKLISHEIGYVYWEWPSPYRYDSLAPGIASGFNAFVMLVISNIIQSVTLWVRGDWWKGAH
jgi:hypothetical protein